MVKLRLVYLMLLFSNLVLKAAHAPEMPDDFLDEYTKKRMSEVVDELKGELKYPYNIFQRVLEDFMEVQDYIKMFDNIDKQSLPLLESRDNETTEERHSRYISVIPENVKAKMNIKDINLMCSRLDEKVVKTCIDFDLSKIKEIKNNLK